MTLVQIAFSRFFGLKEEGSKSLSTAATVGGARSGAFGVSIQSPWGGQKHSRIPSPS